jgi:hypothetical protein
MLILDIVAVLASGRAYYQDFRYRVSRDCLVG